MKRRPLRAAAKIAELQAEQKQIEQSIAGFEGELTGAKRTRRGESDL
jgi:hypothetical protein